MAPPRKTYDPLYLQGIAYFNACEFFEAHEVWEELWKSYSGELRLFYKGLIQAAVALHHFGNGNIRGARKVYRQQPRLFGAIRADVLRAWTWRSSSPSSTPALPKWRPAEEQFPQIEINPELIPEIWLDPPVELPPIEIER